MDVSDFKYIDDLHLIRHVQGDGKLFYVERPYECGFKLDGKDTNYTVPAGTATDFASVPSIVPRWLIEKLDRHIEAAVIHDYMCIVKGPWSSRVAADIFLAAMEAADVSLVTRTLMYRAVVMFGPQWN